MKLKRNFHWLLTAAIFVFLFSCKEDVKTQAELRTTTLIGNNQSWSMKNVMVDDVDNTAMFQGFTLNFSATTFTTTNGKAVWPASGAWTFASSDGTVVKRSDGVEVTVEELTDNRLVLAFSWGQSTFGRLNSIKGKHVFTLGR